MSQVSSLARHLLALESKITGMAHVLTINYTSISAFAAKVCPDLWLSLMTWPSEDIYHRLVLPS